MKIFSKFFIIILMGLLSIYFIPKTVSCDILNDEIQIVKDTLYSDLHLLVRHKVKPEIISIFYTEEILSDKFIWQFLNNVSWNNILTENSNITDIKCKVVDMFYEYVKSKQKNYELNILRSSIYNIVASRHHMGILIEVEDPIYYNLWN